MAFFLREISLTAIERFAFLVYFNSFDCNCRRMNVEVVFTTEDKTISHFCMDGLEFWEGVMHEFTEEELEKWIPDFDELPIQNVYTDPNFIETM